MSAQRHAAPAHAGLHKPAGVVQVFVYGHPALFYWWPLWVAGYVMALLSWRHHDQAIIGTNREWFYPNRNLGVSFTLLLLLLTVVTSTRIKGTKAALIISAMAFFALLTVHLNWWEPILGWLVHQSISLNFGFYLFYSSMLLLIWLISVFLIDHPSFWRLRPGQIAHEYLGGIVENSDDNHNMSFSLNRQDDFFRHWFIGFGAGDLHKQAMGGQGEKLGVDNLKFVGARMYKIQRLIATKPDVAQQA